MPEEVKVEVQPEPERIPKPTPKPVKKKVELALPAIASPKKAPPESPRKVLTESFDLKLKLPGLDR
eukprot:CAMPEP_0185597280 /NCGR_PEP_ID=MMETSP0434-20130131/81270_1 /TAXON_ID=626734 ORGANISM="Favella taraikaensis, Strain Fe Narragansett Bay" /NCGR_SAMPLE_ID=MMETSP0434 /ASSEMBLY_ACC=CAM_ASM_000379 /LENGTH=65 /DNA_ID=CAMNT_0028225967 /DNA_START=32 /DNA_END=229 /DNA_ORIENTATION=-